MITLSPNPKQVLLVIPNLEVGGAERFLVQICPLLRDRGFLPTVCCLLKPGSLSEEMQGAGTPVFNLDLRSRRGLRGLWRLWRILRAGEFSIVHAHLYPSELLSIPLARAAGVPAVISTKHNTGDWMSPHQRVIERQLVGATDAVVASSRAIKQAAVQRGLPDGRIEVIYPSTIRERSSADPPIFTDAREELGIERDALLVGSVGRLHAVKDHRTLLQAAAEIAGVVPNVTLLLAGGGPLEKELRDLAVRLGIEEKTIIRHFPPRLVRDVIASMDVVVLPSLAEGFPMALTEAMALARPIVASDVGGIPEAIQDGKEGILVPPGQVSDLRDALLRVLQDRELARTLGENAKEKVFGKFTVDRAADATADLYDRVLSMKNGKHGAAGRA